MYLLVLFCIGVTAGVCNELQELEKALGKMETAGYSPGSPFPEDRALQEGDLDSQVVYECVCVLCVCCVCVCVLCVCVCAEVGKIYENVLMFGDFLLRMPEMTKKV